MNFNNSRPHEEPPPGSYCARLISLVDLGTQQHSFQGKSWSQRDVRLGFELPTMKMLGTYDPKDKGRPFGVTRTVNQSLHPKATLRALLRGWKGRDFSKEEIAKFDPKTLLGKPCRLNLVQSEEGFVNIESIAPLGKDDKIPKQVNPPTFVSLEPGEFDQAMFDSLGPRTKERIMSSPEYAKLFGESASEGAPDPSQGASEESGSDDAPF